MKPDEKCRRLRVESQAADQVLDEALQPILKKLTIAETDTARGQSSLEEDVRLIAAMDAWRHRRQPAAFLAPPANRREVRLHRDQFVE